MGWQTDPEADDFGANGTNRVDLFKCVRACACVRVRTRDDFSMDSALACMHVRDTLDAVSSARNECARAYVSAIASDARRAFARVFHTFCAYAKGFTRRCPRATASDCELTLGHDQKRGCRARDAETLDVIARTRVCLHVSALESAPKLLEHFRSVHYGSLADPNWSQAAADIVCRIFPCHMPGGKLFSPHCAYN